MQSVLWFFIAYSFIGYCLEKIYAAAIHAPQQTRKCFLLLPLCPVYGLAMTTAAVMVPKQWPFLCTAAAGALICTAVEYLVHWLYETIFSVSFWDYTGEKLNLRGRVCLRFTAIWGILSAVGLKLYQPGLTLLAAAMPSQVTAWVWLLFTADCALSTVVLLRYHNTELLSLPALLRQLRASSQSSTSR